MENNIKLYSYSNNDVCKPGMTMHIIYYVVICISLILR